MTSMATTSTQQSKPNITTASSAPKLVGAGSSVSTQSVVDKLKKRKQRRRTVIILIVGFIVLIGVLVFIQSSKEKPIVVQTEKVARRSITEEVQATGKVQPEVAVKVSPQVPGEVIELPVKEGDKVKEGQLIAKIKPNYFKYQLDQAQASLNSAKGHEQQALAALIQAKADFARATSLKKSELMSQADLDAAEAKYQAAVAQHKSSQFDVKTAESVLQQYSESLSWTTVFAPMAGTVTSLITQLGEKVVGTSQFAGTEMMTVSDLTVMNAMVDVDENDIVNVKLGDSAKVSVDAFPDRTFMGVVIEVANSAELKGNGTQDQSTNFNVKIRLTGFVDGELRPGMSCTANIRTKTKANVLSIPINAVTRREDADSAVKRDSSKTAGGQASAAAEESPVVVFVVGKDSRVKMVTVKTGISDNAYVEILSGLKDDEEVVKGNYTAVSKDLADKKLIRIDNGSSDKSSGKGSKSS
jgi:HlyD family secretion protein